MEIRQKKIDLINDLYDEAETEVKKGEMGNAAEIFFQTAHLCIECEDYLLAAKSFLNSYMYKVQDNRYLKDRPNIKYLGLFEDLLRTEKRYDILFEGYNKISKLLSNENYYDLSREFYIKAMKIRKKYHYDKKNIFLCAIYWIWEIFSLYGESWKRLFIVIIILSFVQTLVLMPAPLKIMEFIEVSVENYELKSFLDYWYMSFSLLFSWDWHSIKPTNIIGLILVLFRFTISVTLVSVFLNLLIRKISPN